MGVKLKIKKSEKVDILLICEGTFPYIKGGVSSWIYQLINGLKEYSFGIIFLGGRKSDYSQIQYKFPENIKYFEEYFLFDKVFERSLKKEVKTKKDFMEKISSLHNWFKSNDEELREDVKKLSFYKDIDQDQFLYSKGSFKFITSQYQKNCPDVPFIDYFWTIRNIHAPIWTLAEAAMNVVDFNLVHSPSTGYAGFLASLLKNNYGKKFILTEHGIYLLERKIDIMLSNWINEYKIELLKGSDEKNYIKDLWFRLFKGINKFSYESADEIISLYSKAQEIQISLGAKKEKTRIIPNGVNIEKYKILSRREDEKIPKVVSLIGRVVPIKDIKTFITAIKIASNVMRDIEGWIVGPTDEDPDYYKECVQLVRTFSLEKNIKFTGFKKLDEVLPSTGLVTLTSISEGMPLVILEAFAAKIPAVTTDVGNCSELIYGKDEEDFKIGKAGEIAPVGKPAILAKLYIQILRDEQIYKKYSKAAFERVCRYYDEKKLFEEYRKLYQKYIKN